MLSVMNNKGGSTEEVARLSRRPELVAEILLDIASLVRGEDRECMQRLLIQAGVFDAICHAARRRPKVRRLCLEAISLFPIALAEPVLRRALADVNMQNRLTAASGLSSIGSPLTISELMALGEPNVVGSKGGLLRESVLARPFDGRRSAKDTRLPVSVRALILDALGQAGDYESLSIFTGHQAHSDPVLRAAAILSIGRLMHPDGIDAIRLALCDVNWCVRAVAAKAAGIGGFDALAPSVGKCLKDPIWSVRFQAIEALKTLGASGASVLITAVHQSDDPELSRLAGTALVELERV